ncbi:MAG TPA: DUF937 domain-containing protein [Bacteroidia bacterium]|nr:DUF937 domain-containing protein [Bacteroidia bacterium]
MLDNLIKLVKDNAGEAIINNPAIPNDKKDAVIEAASHGIMDQLKSVVTGGGTQNIMELFKGGNTSANPMVGQISNSVAQSLMSKFGIESSQAGSIVKSLVPGVLSQLVNKTNDPNDKSFDLQGILSSLGGKSTVGGILESVKKLF